MLAISTHHDGSNVSLVTSLVGHCGADRARGLPVRGIVVIVSALNVCPTQAEHVHASAETVSANYGVQE